MSRAANEQRVFKDRDVRRLIKAVRAAGLNPTAVEVDIRSGRIRVISGKPEDIGGHLDRWLEEHRESPPQRN
jgi:hypothetical protein